MSDIEVIPLGLNLANYPVRENSGKEYDLVFVGNFSHFPNIDGVFYFITKILPLIKRTIPGLSVAIAGAHPPESIKRMAKPGSKITVTGYLGDIKDVYYKARVFITPVRFGTGMRYKILEAQALELPVISTSVAAGGIDRRSLIVADTAYDFSEEIVGLLQDPSRRFDLAKRGRLSVEKNHDSCVLIEKYEFIYNELLNPS
ncbi:MAG: glycosyltransferase [Candidatus Omnitrophica bacterium]|nr:glycosyltransferase [Candidatus Omnitrophota bacterium]